MVGFDIYSIEPSGSVAASPSVRFIHGERAPGNGLSQFRTRYGHWRRDEPLPLQRAERQSVFQSAAARLILMLHFDALNEANYNTSCRQPSALYDGIKILQEPWIIQ